MSTRSHPLAPVAPEQQVALVASARREALLRVHAFRLRWEDLEDCFSQATLELILRVRRDGAFATREHLANALEQRFLSRVLDRRRAIAGRSPMQAALEQASPVGEGTGLIDIADRRMQVEETVIRRHELRRIQALAQLLTRDQRLVLATQLAAEVSRAEFCARHGWSVEKYRKVAQRARTRLRKLIALEEGVRSAAATSEQAPGGLPMTASTPTAGLVPGATGGRRDGRSSGPGPARVRGRGLESLPLRPPAARVDAP